MGVGSKTRPFDGLESITSIDNLADLLSKIQSYQGLNYHKPAGSLTLTLVVLNRNIIFT